MSANAGSFPVRSSSDRLTVTAFAVLVAIGGSNAVAVRFSNLELPPFWGASLRFLATGAIFWAILGLRRIAVPRARALEGNLLYGVLAIGASYAFLYWGLLRIQASLAMVILALGPLFTMLFAVAHGLEPFRWRGLAGALIALTGIALAVGREVGVSVPPASLLAMVAGAACLAEAAVVFKLFPKSHPIATNAIATSLGGLILLAISLVAGETRSLPSERSTWVAFSYLVLVGSVILFYLYLFVLSRWTASATSYAALLFPVATVIIASVLTHETITPRFIAGGIVVLLGVYIGSLQRSAAPVAAQASRADSSMEIASPTQPGCA
jgi:drug/metabolite transporter (DMT)-like permease